MKLGRVIYYDSLTGNVILDKGERQGSFTQTSIEQDIRIYTALFERNPETFDYIELEYGQYAQGFMDCNGYRVNPNTLELEFSYPDPNEEPQEPVYQKPLSEEVEKIKLEGLNNKEAIADLYVMSMGV